MLDFVLAAVALCFLLYGLWGVGMGMAALADMRALELVCGETQCDHHGVLAAHSVTYTSANWLFGPGGGFNYCMLAMDLDVGRRQAAVVASTCARVADGGPVDAEIWRGNVVSVTTSAGRMGTLEHPAAELYLGLYRSVALLAFALFVVLIHIDVANHRAVWMVRRRIDDVFRRRSADPRS